MASYSTGISACSRYKPQCLCEAVLGGGLLELAEHLSKQWSLYQGGESPLLEDPTFHILFKTPMYLFTSH